MRAYLIILVTIISFSGCAMEISETSSSPQHEIGGNEFNWSAAEEGKDIAYLVQFQIGQSGECKIFGAIGSLSESIGARALMLFLDADANILVAVPDLGNGMLTSVGSQQAPYASTIAGGNGQGTELSPGNYTIALISHAFSIQSNAFLHNQSVSASVKCKNRLAAPRVVRGSLSLLVNARDFATEAFVGGSDAILSGDLSLTVTSNRTFSGISDLQGIATMAYLQHPSGVTSWNRTAADPPGRTLVRDGPGNYHFHVNRIGGGTGTDHFWSTIFGFDDASAVQFAQAAHVTQEL